MADDTVDPELLKRLLDPTDLRRITDPARHSDLALAESIDKTRPRIATVVPETGAAPAVDTSALAAPSLGKIGEAKTLPTLSYKEQQRLPVISAGAPAGSAASYETQLERLQTQKEHPWGTEENHPGRLGRIGHVLGQIGNIAGDIVAPRTMEAIPGTALNREAQIHAIEPRLAKARTEESQEELRSAQAGEARGKEYAALHPELAVGKTPEERTFADLLTQTNPDTKQLYTPLEAYQKVTQTKTTTDETKQPLAEAGATQHAKELETLTAGMSPDEKKRFTDAYAASPNDTHAVATKRLEDAKASAALTAGERDRKLQRDIAEKNHQDQQAQRNLTNALETVEFTDPKSGQKIIGSFAEAQAAGAKNPRKVQPGAEEKSRQFYANSARLLQNAQSISDSLPAWDNPQDKELAMRVQKQFVNGLHVPGVTGITGDYIDTFLNSEDFQKMTPAGQAHMQNVLQLYSDVLQMIKTETGANPRGEVMFETEKKILPSPEKTQAMNRQAIDQLEKRIRADAKAQARPSDMGPLQGVIPPDAQSRLLDPDTNAVVGYKDKAGKRVLW